MIDRTTAPKASGTISFMIPQIRKLITSNGVEIYHVKKEKLPIVQLIAISQAGGKFDPPEKKGLSFLTSLMIDEGAGEFNSLQLNNELEKLGTIMSISSDHDSLSFSILSLGENFDRSFELLSKILNEPRMEEKDFDREKKKMLDKILQLKDEPSYIASQAFDKLIFNKNYYGKPTIGLNETVRNISLKDIKNFYNEKINRSVFKFIAAGNISADEIIELTEKYIRGKRSQVEEPSFIPSERSKTKFYFIDKKDSAQSEIRIGHLSKTRDAEDFYSTRIMNTILGGQFSSRINLNLREHKGFTYGAHSTFNYLQNAGSFEVSTSVNIENTGESIVEIIKELNGIRKNISEEEINFAKSYSIKQFPSRFETYTQTARNIVPLIIHSLPTNYYDNYTTHLESVSKEEISEAALNNIFPDELIVLSVGEKNKIEPQLKSISEGHLIELDIHGEKIS